MVDLSGGGGLIARVSGRYRPGHRRAAAARRRAGQRSYRINHCAALGLAATVETARDQAFPILADLRPDCDQSLHE